MTQRSPRLKRSVELLLLGTAAGVAVACGSQATDMAGDLAEEVGDMLTDAGVALEEAGAEMLDGAADPATNEHDAQAAQGTPATQDAQTSLDSATVTEMLAEAGAMLMSDAGELLRDAGAVLHDAGANAHEGGSHMASDASAQSCATCNGTGALHALPASENPAHQIGGSRAKGSWTKATQVVPQTNYTLVAFYAALVDGPAVLTDIERASVASNAPMSIYTVPKGSACVAPPGGPGLAYVLPAQARLLLLNTASSQTHGAHLNVRADETACALAANGADTPDLPFAVDPGNAAITWSGYRLYE